jgi:hypothetical protein
VSKNMRASMWIVGLAIALVVLLVASMNSMQTVDETEPSSAKTTTGRPQCGPRRRREDTTATVSTSTIKTASPATVYAGGLYVEPWGHAASAAKELEAEESRIPPRRPP